MVISAGPLTRVFTGVASHLGVHAVYLDTRKNLSVFAPRLPCFCGIARSRTYLKNYFSISLSLSLALFSAFCRFSRKKEGGEKRKKNVSEEHLFTYHLGRNERKETRDNSSAFSWISWELKLESILSGSIVGNKHRTPFSLPPR